MEGVILFADDHIFDTSRLENALFNKFNSDGNYSVLPIDNLTVLEKTVASISTYKALILDWNFKREMDEDEGNTLPDDNPHSLLKENMFYSLVYIYSQAEIPIDTKSELEELYPGKIYFETKGSSKDADAEYEKITKGIKKFEDENSHLTVPYIWSQSINQSVQKIFASLENADPNWVKDLYYSSFHFKKDKPIDPPSIDPNIQVINLFLNILSEHLIQNNELRTAIKEYSENNLDNETDVEKLESLYQFLYYTQLSETDAIMTGDVYQLEENKYGIIISPECDINALIKKDKRVELLCFEKGDFDDKFYSIFQIAKDDLAKIQRAYNQENPRGHLLPVFPIDLSTKESVTAFIDFRFSMEHFQGKYLEERITNRTVKINSPYIQQLRQRYLAYVGRIGVPTIPNSLR